MQAPHPDNPTWPAWRNNRVRHIQRSLLRYHQITPYSYQEVFLEPPAPYSLDTLKFVQHGGAKRIGKSFLLALKAESYCLLPRSVTRVYGVEYDNTQREFNHLVNLLFRSERPLVQRFPQLQSELVEFNEDPDQGALKLKWSWGAEVVSKSWERRNKWLGEPIDLGIISEPGLFDSIKVYTKYIEPNLTDRRGICYSAGTVDNPWMEDVHDMAHDHDEHPDIYCVCEIPMWMNRSLNLTRQDIEMMRERLTARDFAINVLGLWGIYEDYAYNTEWMAASHVLVLDRASWLALKKGKPGWDRFLALDTGGRFNACGEYAVSPQGYLMMIDEWTNYHYRAGQIVQTDERGFRVWFSERVMPQLNYQNLPIVYVDPSSHFKPDIQGLGLGWVDAVNAHDSGANAVNEYLHRRRLKFVRPQGRAPYVAEQEIPRVRWEPTESGIGGKQRLKRGNDHSADQVRYAAATRPIGTMYEPERKKTVIEQDDEWLMLRRDQNATALFADMPAMGGEP